MSGTKRSPITILAAFVVAALAALTAPLHARGQSLVLDPSSSSLPAIPATAGDILTPSAAMPPSAPPPLAVGLTAAQLGLVAGDVIDAMTFIDDGPLGPSTIYFSVDRASVGAGVVGPPDVTGESTVFVPPGIQGEAASDIFVSNDPVCAPLGFNHQILDGNGALLGPPSVCGYGGGAPYGLGLTELLPLPGPPRNDDLSAFDWGTPGRARLFCLFLSLAPGSPTLTPGGNPLLPGGAEPGDVLVSCPGPGVGPPPFIIVIVPAAPMGLVSGGPGCVPPLCDDIDALSFGGGSLFFSLSPLSPSVTGPPFFSAADILTPPAPVVVMPAAGLGLLPTDNVDALELVVNPCPLAAGVDAPDFDGVGPGPGCDNCPATFNPGQEDSDFDGIGDACDPCTDTEGDGFGNPGFPANACPVDLCPYTPGPNIDTDGDGLAFECDNCPTVANPAQTDTDIDFVGNACDNCPIDPNVGQTDGDGDGIGDACDICTAGVGMTKAQLKLNKLLAPGGDDQLQIQGNMSFPGLTLPTPPLDVLNQGMRVQIIDLGAGSTVLLDHQIPGGPVPNVCGPKDGWKTNATNTSQKYANKTTSIPPGCAPGSDLGINQAQAQDKAAKLKGGKFKVKGKNGTYVPATGPFRVTIVLGGAAESAAGQCADHTFAPADCSINSTGKTLKCKQP